MKWFSDGIGRAWGSKIADVAVSEYIDGFYNCERRHSTLGSVSPIVFEQRHLARLKKDTDAGSARVPPLRKRSQERPEVAVY